MAELILNAEVRNKVGKEDAKKLRAKELIPTVVYGKNVTPLHCAISKHQIDKLLRKVNRNALITLKLSDNEAKIVIVRDHQKHPISHEYVHLDLQAVDMNHPIKVDVDLEFIGTPIGKKSGGVFTSMCKQVKVECLPSKIPEVIKLNIDDLDAGESLHVSDIKAVILQSSQIRKSHFVRFHRSKKKQLTKLLRPQTLLLQLLLLLQLPLLPQLRKRLLLLLQPQKRLSSFGRIKRVIAFQAHLICTYRDYFNSFDFTPIH